MPTQHSNSTTIVRFLLLGILLLGVVFLIPDAGQLEHRSFFTVAQHSVWGQLFEWPAAWCSTKIIVLSISALLIVEASLTVAMRVGYRMACMALLFLAILALALGTFGFYELAKALL